jgi:hypothetical protein
MNYIRVKNWDNFQAYHDGRPIIWIKLYLKLLENEDFEDLPDASKLTLLLLWLFNARKGDGNIKADERYLAKKLSIRQVKLQPLIDAGFIDLYEQPDKPVQNRTQNRIEKSREEKKKRVQFEDEYSPEYEAFWKKWKGRWNQEKDKYIKVKKHLGWEHWKSLSKDDQRWAYSAADKVSGKYTPDAPIWLRDRMFRDYPKPSQAPAG